MRTIGRRAGVVAAAIVCWTSHALAQPGEFRRTPRIGGESFVLGRYATGGVASLYVAARAGRASVFAGITGSGQRGSLTSIAGIGTRLRFTNGVSSSVFVGAARTPVEFQARLYMLPKATVGPVVISAVGLLSESMRDGARHVSVNPLMAAYRVTRWLQLGGTTVVERIGERSSRTAIGPAAHVRLMGVLLTLEEFATSTTARREVRVSIVAR